jgi:protein TonB
MFNKLVASAGKRRGGWSPTTIAVSIAVHGLVLAGAVYASVTAPAGAEKEEELVTFVEIPEEAPAAEEASPPPPPEVEPAAVPPPPKGFQELIPPLEPPAALPEVDNSLPPVDVQDFSGLGQAGGTSTGIEGGTPQDLAAVDSSTFAYETHVLSRQPELRNLSQVRSFMERNYPRMLQDAGIGGNAVLQFVVEADGTVEGESVTVVQASHDQFADVSKRVAERFRFRPGVYQNREVRVLVRMPITWQPAR